jgi:hypothetical protein
VLLLKNIKSFAIPSEVERTLKNVTSLLSSLYSVCEKKLLLFWDSFCLEKTNGNSRKIIYNNKEFAYLL